jgi:hypothetical protein
MARKRESVKLLLALIDEAFEKQSWHGPNLRGSLRGVTHGQSSWRPGRGRHNIWEIALHTAYWKYAVRRRILGEKRGSFALRGSNWFVSPARGRKTSWKGAVQLLENEHRAMRAAIAALSDADLEKKAPSSKITHRRIITGIASHDLYHAGQIQLLKRLQRRS